MLDLAQLGLDIDSTKVKQAREEMDRFSKEGKRADNSAKGVTKSTAAMAAGMRNAAIAIGTVVAAMAAIGGGVRTLAQFEKQMSTVGAVSRATAAELDAMRDIAAELGGTTEFTAQQAGEGLEFLARAGFSASEAVSAIPAVLDLATASAMGLGNAADISSNIMSAFGIAATDASDVADVLAAASSRANTDVQQLGTAMSFVGPVASALGIEMSDAAAAIGVLSDAGIQGSSAGTGLRRVLSSLANATPQATAVIEGLGLTLEELNPQTNDITEIVERLAGAGLSAADALTVFGDRGGPAILALTSQTGRLDELTLALTDVENEAARMANTMRDNLGGDLDSLFSAIQSVILALGDAGLTAVIRGVVQGLTALARTMTQIIDLMSDGASAISGTVRSLLGFASTEEIMQQAIDNASLAMGDQIEQVQRLSRAQGSSNIISLESARVRLAEAEAVRELIVAQAELARQQFLEDAGFDDLMLQAERLRRELEEVQSVQARAKEQGITLPGFAGSEAEIENVNRLLAQTLSEIEAIRIAAEGQSFLRPEDAQRLEELKARAAELGVAIEGARDGQVMLNGEWVEGVELTDRLGILANQINFDSATESARLLAAQIGVGVDEAIALNRALNSSAGIPENSAPRLSFPGGAPNASTPGGFTASGGQLVFGNLNGPDPSDFIPDRVSSRGSGGSGASAAAREAEREAEAIQDVVDKLREQIEVVGLSEEARQTHQALQRAGVDIYSEEGQQIAELVGQYREMEAAQRANEEITRTLKGAILDFADGGVGAIDSVTSAIKRMALEALLFGEGPLSGMFGGSGGGGFLSGIGDLFSLFQGGSLLSFDGGGYTGSGSRSGGVDGKGGFPAILHPNERVTDLTRGGGGGGTNVSVQVFAPEGTSVREERQQTPDGERIRIFLDQAVADLASQPGTAINRALGGGFGLRPVKRSR